MKSYPTKFKSFLWKIVQMGTLQKLQNSIQTLLIFWPVYPIHTNSLFWVIFVALPFCHFPPPNTSIRGKDSKNKVDLSFEYILVLQTNGKQPYSFPVLSRFCNGLLRKYCIKLHRIPLPSTPVLLNASREPHAQEVAPEQQKITYNSRCLLISQLQRFTGISRTLKNNQPN